MGSDGVLTIRISKRDVNDSAWIVVEVSDTGPRYSGVSQNQHFRATFYDEA